MFKFSTRHSHGTMIRTLMGMIAIPVVLTGCASNKTDTMPTGSVCQGQSLGQCTSQSGQQTGMPARVAKAPQTSTKPVRAKRIMQAEVNDRMARRTWRERRMAARRAQGKGTRPAPKAGDPWGQTMRTVSHPLPKVATNPTRARTTQTATLALKAASHATASAPGPIAQPRMAAPARVGKIRVGKLRANTRIQPARQPLPPKVAKHQRPKRKTKPTFFARFNPFSSSQGDDPWHENLRKPASERKGADLVTASIPGSSGKASRKGRRIKVMTIASIGRYTLQNSPDIGIFTARAEDAGHGVRAAQSVYRPNINVRVAAGLETTDTKKNEQTGAFRREGTVKLKQHLYDFGYSSNTIKRAKYLHESAQFRLIDKAEAVMLEVSEAYLDVMEQSRYIANARQNIQAHAKFYKLVKASEQEGNATQADVQRAFSRLENARTQVIDFETNRQTAIGRFRRLTGLEPGKLRMPPTFSRQANLRRRDIKNILRRNPRLIAIARDSESLKKQAKSQRATSMPSFRFEAEANAKQNVSGFNKQVRDYRGMLVMSWNLYDGGRKYAVEDQIMARLKENQYRYRKYYHQLEEDLMQAIRTIATSRKKSKTINDQIRASEKVATLYTQQFSVGKKGLFEVLDAQRDLFSARRDRIANQFEQIRANYRSLRLKGKLVQTITGKTLFQ